MRGTLANHGEGAAAWANAATSCVMLLDHTQQPLHVGGLRRFGQWDA